MTRRELLKRLGATAAAAGACVVTMSGESPRPDPSTICCDGPLIASGQMSPAEWRRVSKILSRRTTT
jgi:hypothetical protein